ncbi:MAG: tetratricopeptide repeat protein [Candidatus Eisenbacteria bacterium]|nr:tetratricopeptide repeat protein [Candidatus Eisenbacteria bacterium]
MTDEERAEGKVLPICLEEIHRCRPYFIGILAERYGWLPGRISEEMIEKEPRLREHLDHSVTELEILHGVLRNPEMAEHAFFYFRDPAYVENLPGENRAAHRAESPEAAEKLRALKERIRASGLPVREGYANPRTLGALVLRDMREVIDRLFPEDETLDPLDREALDHEAFAESRARVYIPREDYYARLDGHAAGDGPPLVVLGESGSGKSALLEDTETDRAWLLGLLLADTGHPEEAFRVRRHLAEHFRCRELGTKDSLQRSVGNQASILEGLGRLDEAIELHKEREHICRELGNEEGLRESLGDQALILRDWGRLDEAMTLLKDVERICRELGNPEGLALSLASQASALAFGMKKPGEALPLAEEALRISTDHGLTALADQIRPIVNQVRAKRAG